MVASKSLPIHITKLSQWAGDDRDKTDLEESTPLSELFDEVVCMERREKEARERERWECFFHSLFIYLFVCFVRLIFVARQTPDANQQQIQTNS